MKESGPYRTALEAEQTKRMSFLDQNRNPSPPASPGPRPILAGAVSSAVLRPTPLGQSLIPQAGGPADPPAFNFQVLRSLRMHSKLALLVGLLVCLVLVALGLQQPKTYTAKSIIYVEAEFPRNLNEQTGAPGFDQFRYASFLDQQMQTIVRPDVLTAALRTLPNDTWRGPLESEQSSVIRLSKLLLVERDLLSYQISVQLKTSNPEAAAAIVNAVTAAYLQRGREDEFKQADLREQTMSEERDRVKQELEIDRKEQAALGASMGLASPAEGAANPYDLDLATLRTQLATARQARDAAAAQLSSISGPEVDHRSGLNAQADEAINTDPGLSAKKSAVNARRVVLETMMAGMTPSNPQYRQAQDEIADLDRALDAKTAEVRGQTERRIQDKLRTDLQRTAEVESKVNAQLAQATTKATGAGPKLQRAAELASDIQRLTARYTTVDSTLTALQLQTSGPGMAHVPVPAVVPITRDPNHSLLFFIAALPLGLICGVSTAVIARWRDRRVLLGSDLQQALGFAPIAVLPAREDVSAAVTDEYVLRLAAGIESAYRTAGARSFVVTAVSAHTDTTALLRDLASKLEALRLRVHVTCASELLITSQETMEHQAADAALIADGATRRMIEAGEGIAAAKLDRLMGRFDLILIDAAPLLHSAETEYVARCSDATILVVQSGLTQIPELTLAASLLSHLRVTGVGAVLDQLKLDQADPAFCDAIRSIELRHLEGVHANTPPLQRQVMAAADLRKSTVAGTSASVELLEKPDISKTAAPAQPAPEATAPQVAPPPSFLQPQGAGSDNAAPSFPVEGTLPPRPLSPAATMQRVPAPAEHFTLPTSAEFERATTQPGAHRRFELLDQLARASALSAEETRSLPAGMGGEASADFAEGDDPNALGRFLGDKDEIGAVPPYTRSRIRLAFKEQEVNSKTTWFSKLFRGDPPSSFRIIPDETEQDENLTEVFQETSQTVPVRLPQTSSDGDPELAHLLNRIKSSGETKIAPRARAVALEEEPALPSGPPVPFGERRTTPRPVDIDESHAFNSATLAPVLVPQISGVPLWEPPAPSSQRSSLASDPSSPALGKPSDPLEGASQHPGRPLRPLTFQQLAGDPASVGSPEPRRSPAASPLPSMPPAAFEPQSARLAPPKFPVISSHSVQRSGQASPQPEGYPATALWKTPEVTTASSGFVSPDSHTGVPTWPAKEPIVTSYAEHSEPIKTPAALGLSPAALKDEAAPESVVEQALAEPSPEPHVASSNFSPSARRAPAQRIPVVPDPMSDPAPTHRPYRLEHTPNLDEKRSTSAAGEPAAGLPSIAEVPPGTSFPPLHEARQQMFSRRKSDHAEGSSQTPGLTRHWKLLSQFEPVVTDPLPAHRKAYTRSTDFNASSISNEG